MTIREEIKKYANKVPQSVQSGSVQVAIRWKDKAAGALRVAHNNSSTEHELRKALSDLKRDFL